MNTKIWIACAAISAMGTLNTAQAAGGVIHFQGVIAAPTCGLQSSDVSQGVLESVCPSANGMTRGQVRISEHMRPTSVGANNATLTLRPVVKEGAPLPGVYIAQVQYI